MHVCYLCSEYPPAPHGGIGTFCQVLAREVVRSGHRASVVGLYAESFRSEDDQGVRVLRIARGGVPVLRSASHLWRLHAALRELHRQDPIDIIEGAEIDLYVVNKSFPAVKVLRMHGGPTFFDTGKRIQVWKERRSFAVAARLCAVSHCVAEGTRNMLHLGPVPIEVIPNPVNTDQFSPDPDTVEEGLIVFAGTVIPRKGIRELIQAMPAVVAAVPGARLEVYGGEAIDPPPRNSLTAQLRASLAPEVARRIEWKGRVPREVLPQALRRASVCVYPSYIEAMPIAWIEAMAAGKAVVASRTGPGPELIDDGVTGLLCDPYDPASIAAQLIRALADPALNRQLGKAARHTAMERYALPKIVQRNLDYYSSLVEPGRLSRDPAILRP